MLANGLYLLIKLLFDIIVLRRNRIVAKEQ